jgi:hypothetical protein
MNDVKDETNSNADRQTDRRATDRVIPPESGIVVPFQLPPITTRRWVARRKAEVVAAVHAGMLSALEACRRYRLSPDEFLEWERHYLAGDLGWPKPAGRALH